MKRINGKELAIDILIDFVGGFLIAVGIYNFAAKAQFPMTGFSGIALTISYTDRCNDYFAEYSCSLSLL